MAEQELNVAEVAERLRVTPWTVREWLRKGQLQGYPLGGRAGWRIPQRAVDGFLVARSYGDLLPRVEKAISEVAAVYAAGCGGKVETNFLVIDGQFGRVWTVNIRTADSTTRLVDLLLWHPSTVIEKGYTNDAAPFALSFGGGKADSSPNDQQAFALRVSEKTGLPVVPGFLQQEPVGGVR